LGDSTFELEMSTLHPFHQDNSYPERKWVAVSAGFFFVYYAITRLVLHRRDLPEPFETISILLIYLPILVGGWLAIGRLGHSLLWRLSLFIPLVGFFVAVIFLMLSARRSRMDRRRDSDAESNGAVQTAPSASSGLSRFEEEK